MLCVSVSDRGINNNDSDMKMLNLQISIHICKVQPSPKFLFYDTKQAQLSIK